MNHNKKTILHAIESLKIGVAMEADIREIMKAQGHHKQVTQRFCDAMKAKGWSSWITRDKYGAILNCTSKTNDDDYQRFRLNVSQFSEKRPITWDLIEYELDRYQYADRLRTFVDMLQAIDTETAKLKELYQHLESQRFTCFNLYNVKRDIRMMLEYAEKDGK